MCTVEIASECGQAVSITEILRMLSCKHEPEVIQEIIDADPFFAGFLRREKELVVVRGYESLFSERTLRQIISRDYLEKAIYFSDHMVRRSSGVKMMAVSGSVAYGSASASDDIDIFLVTKTNRAWICLFKALLLARALSLKAHVNGAKANYCLSYMQDMKEFEQVLKQQRSPLLAREFLSMHVLVGVDYYYQLLGRNTWIGQIFPRLGGSGIMNKDQTGSAPVENLFVSLARDFLNISFFPVLKIFLSFKAFCRNLEFRKQQKTGDLFEARITQGSCVYTSNKYRRIERMYASINEPEA
jgi:predicted nucleotidyltransferase